MLKVSKLVHALFVQIGDPKSKTKNIWIDKYTVFDSVSSTINHLAMTLNGQASVSRKNSAVVVMECSGINADV